MQQQLSLRHGLKIAATWTENQDQKEKCLHKHIFFKMEKADHVKNTFHIMDKTTATSAITQQTSETDSS